MTERSEEMGTCARVPGSPITRGFCACWGGSSDEESAPPKFPEATGRATISKFVFKNARVPSGLVNSNKLLVLSSFFLFPLCIHEDFQRFSLAGAILLQFSVVSVVLGVLMLFLLLTLLSLLFSVSPRLRVSVVNIGFGCGSTTP